MVESIPVTERFRFRVLAKRLLMGIFCLAVSTTIAPTAGADETIDPKVMEEALAKLKAKQAAATRPSTSPAAATLVPPEVSAASARVVEAKTAVKRREAARDAAKRAVVALEERASRLRLEGKGIGAAERKRISDEGTALAARRPVANAALTSAEDALKHAVTELASADGNYRMVMAKWPGIVKETVSEATGGSKPISTPKEILAMLPPELQRPDATWDKFDFPKVNEWLQSNAPGTLVQFPVTVDRFIVSGPPWRVTVVCEQRGIRSNAVGRSVSLIVYPQGEIPAFGPYTFDVDEATARIFDKKKGGYAITLGGTIEQARVSMDALNTQIVVRVSAITGLEQLQK